MTQTSVCEIQEKEALLLIERRLFQFNNAFVFGQLEIVALKVERRLRRIVRVGHFPCLVGEGKVALVFPVPVSRSTGAGYPFPFSAAISITTSF